MPSPEKEGPHFTEGRLRFQFRPGWEVRRYDASEHHQKRFQGSSLAPKACDFVALEPGGGVWLIEVKDHSVVGRHPKRQDLMMELLEKYRDTMAGLLGMGQLGPPKEARFANRCLQALGEAKPLHLVLHLKVQEGGRLFSHSNQRDRLERVCKCLTKKCHIHFEGKPFHATGPWTVVDEAQAAGGHAP